MTSLANDSSTPRRRIVVSLPIYYLQLYNCAIPRRATTLLLSRKTVGGKNTKKGFRTILVITYTHTYVSPHIIHISKIKLLYTLTAEALNRIIWTIELRM